MPAARGRSNSIRFSPPGIPFKLFLDPLVLSLPSPSSPNIIIMAAPIASKDQPLSGVALYSRFAFAGACCCSITHGAVTPLDV